MPAPTIHLVLMPGMDGTGELFADFVSCLPHHLPATIIRYSDQPLGYADLLPLVKRAIPDDPFVIVAESFSTPLAIELAATHPPNLKALVLCAGFATNPVPRLLRPIASRVTPRLTTLPLPKFAVRRWLTGSTASPTLVAAVRAATASSTPQTRSSRLRHIFACDVRAELARIVVPILCLQPKDDKLIGPSGMEEIHSLKPSATVVHIDGPHLLLQRLPQQTAAIIADFIHQLS
jgi:pimeloyl-[acyl-carrier protein] methyl ester esterase